MLGTPAVALDAGGTGPVARARVEALHAALGGIEDLAGQHDARQPVAVLPVGGHVALRRQDVLQMVSGARHGAILDPRAAIRVPEPAQDVAYLLVP